MEKILDKINQAGLSLLEITSPEETYSVVVKEAIKLVNAEYGVLYLVVEGKLKSIYESDPVLLKQKPKKRSSLEKAYKKNKIILDKIEIISDTKLNNNPEEIKTIIWIPLVYRRNVVGVLEVLSQNVSNFNTEQIEVLKVFCSMASFAIKKSQLYTETRKALEIRDMFISMAAHELRTPLTSISGYIQLLHNKFANSDNPSKKWIDALYEENKRMMHLVKELLEVNRLKAGQMQFRWQECDLATIIEESVKVVSSKFTERKIILKNNFYTDSPIIGDCERLRQVFINLIDNALKYSSSAYPVEITSSVNNNSYKVLIKDYGKGIDKKDLPNIFAGHHKGEGGEEGFGLGLFFVENIIRQHRGDLNVRSKINKGTVMEVKLPKANYNEFK